MKIKFTLTENETIECFTAFGLSALLSCCLIKKSDDFVYRSPISQVIPSPYYRNQHWYNWLNIKGWQWFRLKHNSKVEWLCGLFGVRLSELVYEVFDMLFGFDNGIFDRGLSITKIVMKSGEVITDYEKFEDIAFDENAKNLIDYSECEIEIDELA
jgi:hypothetical protein